MVETLVNEKINFESLLFSIQQDVAELGENAKDWENESEIWQDAVLVEWSDVFPGALKLLQQSAATPRQISQYLQLLRDLREIAPLFERIGAADYLRVLEEFERDALPV